jgi:vacuolar-type H+-ATPase catalytic subunit A/Vma1
MAGLAQQADWWQQRETLRRLENIVHMLDEVFAAEVDRMACDSANLFASALYDLEEVIEEMASELGVPAQLPPG